MYRLAKEARSDPPRYLINRMSGQVSTRVDEFRERVAHKQVPVCGRTTRGTPLPQPQPRWDFSQLTIAGLLGHSVPGVTARYAHVPDSALVAQPTA